MSVIIKLLSKFDDSGLKKAKKGFSGLTKTLGAVGIGLSLKSLTGDLVDAAKAASMDQKSTQLLNNQLIKNAKATTAQTKANDKFIQTLSEQVGIVDDELRPAQARLARATGSVKKSQDLLKLALDASAVSGKPLATVSAALGKAFNGSTGALIKLFPELKKSKDLFGDLRKEVEGTAAQQADPFAKLNVAMDNLKEKLGMTIMPIVLDFIDIMMKPGGAIEQVGKFLDDVSNPKTEAGKTFLDIKKAVMETIGGVKDFFALFGNGDAMKGFAVVAGNLIKALPALLALKGIMVLAQSATAIQNLIIAMLAIQGKNPLGDSPIGKASKYLIPAAIAVGTAEVALNEFSKPQTKIDIANAGKSKIPAYNPGMNKGLFVDKNGFDSSGKYVGQPNGNNIFNITVTNADPKAVIDAIGKYVKQNGSLPGYFITGKAGR
jgi:hypothetical protein